MQQSKHRFWSFIAVALIYIFATILGVFVYNIFVLSPWLKLLIADVIATIFVFVWSVVFKNASVYDPYWSVQPMVIGAITLFSTNNWSLFNLLLLCVVLLWGARLTANWAYTFYGLDCQDWRYTLLKEKTKKAYPIVNFVGIHLVPTLVVYGCILPMFVAFQQNVALTWDNVDCLIFLAISLCAVAMQCVADVEMHKFRKDKQSGKTTDTFIRRGVWKHSRHPNYLAEILMWWGVGLSVVTMLPHSWYLLFGALANTLLFVFVSIPLADGKQSKKQGFDQYKAQTFALLPLPKSWIKKQTPKGKKA